MVGALEVEQQMKTKAKSIPASEDPRQAEAAKTSRLRALRLAKEAAEKEAAERAAATNPGKAPRRRVRAALPADQPEPA